MAIILCLLITGCAGDPAPRLAQDVASRHPIAVRDASETLYVEIAPTLDAASRTRISNFASVWRQERPQRIEARMPPRGPQEKMARAQLDRIRHLLVAEGVQSSIYLTRDANWLAETPVITMRFTRMKAEVVTPCGVWPDDLASGSSLSGWDNAPYANFGCAHQTMMAVQTADPRDLSAMRAMSPADGEMRARALSAMRRGQDPNVNWGIQSPSISGARN